MRGNKFYLYLDVKRHWYIKESEEGDYFEVTAYASTPHLDRQHDIIIRPALQHVVEQLKTINTTVFYGHQYDRENTVGKIVDAGVDDIGLWVKIYVSKTEPKLREKIREGIISKLSIGGQVKSYKRITADRARELKYDVPEDVEEVRIVDRIDIYEVSFVGVPANPHARVVDFTKSLYETIHEQLQNFSDKEGGEEMSDIKKQEELEKKDKETKEEEETKETAETEDTATEEKTSKEEVTEEEIKDLLEDSKEEEEKKEENDKYKYPYYYYRYGKHIKEMLEKLGEAIAKLQETADKILAELKKKDEKPAEEITPEEEEKSEVETKDEKISEIKTSDPIDTKKNEDPDKKLLDWIKG
ncbi:MAG: HK97 family phage prohead protease [Candidatus Odinarchaeia archaeon]